MQQQQTFKTKIEDLFANTNEDNLSYFYTSNQIISSTDAVEKFFLNFSQYNFEEQENILNSIIKAIKKITTNAYFLNNQPKQKQNQSNQTSIINIIIDLIPQNVKNYLLFNLLVQLLQLLLPTSSLKEQLIRPCTSRILREFYDGKVQVDQIFGTVNVLKTIYAAKIEAQKQPKNMMEFHNSKGLQIMPVNKNQPTTWKFEQGMTMMFWIYIEDIKFGNQNKLPKIFTFYSPNKGGVQSYLIDTKVYYRIIGSKYSQPQIGSNGINLGELQPRKWNFICYEHQGSKVFMKSKLNFYINKSKVATFSIDPPKISKGNQTKYVFFDNFYGKTSSIGMFTHPIGNQQIDQYNKNINSIQHIKKTKAYLFELREGRLYQRSGFGYSPQYVLERDLTMNFHTISPFFYMLRFIEEKYEYPILNELFGLIVLFFRKSAKSQSEAVTQEYFKLVSILISKFRISAFDQNSVKSILHIKHTITDTHLLDQYFSDLLWSMVSCKTNWQRKQQMIEIIKNGFTQNIGHYQQVVGFDEMLNYLCKLEAKSVSCCQKHYKLVVKKLSSSFNFQDSSQAQRTTINYILQIIQLYFQNTNISFAQDCYKLCRLLTLKFSPCFILDLINLIKKIVDQKLKEKISQSQTKKILKYFQEKNIYLIFLQVIENNFFAEIKAQGIKMIYKVLLRKISQKEQMEVSQSISRSLWKINEQNQIISPRKEQTSIDQQKQEQKYQKSQKSQQVQVKVSMNKMKGNKKMAILQIQKQQKQEQEQYRQVGPIAPKLRNKDKGSKSFDFSFANNKIPKAETSIQRHFPKPREIVEQEKTIDIQQDGYDNSARLILPIKKKGKRTFGLSINTQQINQMYNFGGEKGQQIIVSQEQQTAEIQKIRRLAKICADSMRNQGVKQEDKQEQQLKQSVQEKKQAKSLVVPMMAPPTTKNKTLQQRKKKFLNLNFINQEEQQEENPTRIQRISDSKSPVSQTASKQQKQRYSTSSKKYQKTSNISPVSNKSSTSQDNLIALYNSLLECCLGLSFQTSMIEHSIVQIPSVLCIFFKWIPQTELETKFLNDMDIITQEPSNMEKIIKIPQLYDFVLELTYKCLILQDMGEKRIYAQKLEKFIMKIFSYVFRQDPVGSSKYIFLLDWAQSKKNDYHPKLLTFCIRSVSLLIVDSFQEYLMKNKNNDRIMEKNFQSFGVFLQSLLKYIPNQQSEQIILSDRQIVIIAQDTQIPQSIAPHFKSAWIDETICQKYFYLFNKYFCTEWYTKNLLKLRQGQSNFVQEVGITQLNKESAYYLRQNFLVSLIEITRSIFMSKDKSSKQYIDLSDEIIWQLIALIILSQSSKQKTMKNHRSQRILTFLKNCKLLAELQVNKIAQVVPLISHTKHFLGILKMNSHSKDEKPISSSTNLGGNDGVLDEIISNYIPEQLLNLDKANSIDHFRLHFSDVWIPSENNQKKRIRSDLFSKYEEIVHLNEDKTMEFIQKISDIIQEQNQRFQMVQTLLQTDRRKILNKFRKTWDNQRLYSRIWKVPSLSMQIDTLFSKSTYTYEKYRPSPFIKYKVSKHQSKAKARYLLKPRLTQNQLIKIQRQTKDPQQKNQIHLSKALTYLITKKIMSISKSRISWISQKQNNIQIVFPFKKVSLVTTLTIRTGHLAIINDKILFTASSINQKPSHLAIKEYQLRSDKSFYKLWPLQYVKQVVRRRFVNRKRAVQITLIHGKSILFQFKENAQLQQFFKKITKLKGNKCPNLSVVSKTADAKKINENYGYLTKWNNFQMSNFEYLMQLNNISGRSYVDTTQYPVMPWILVDFSSSKLNLINEISFRNLQLPMGALGKQQRAMNFQERYKMLTVDDNQERRFHYGTHYSSPGIIYHFLIRLNPFTQGAVLLQGGKFDFADRLFFSMGDSFKNSTTQHSDVRQLLPELYTIPQTYLNINKNQFGLMQNKKRVNNVELPEWTRQNPYLYVTKLRKAFQENIVSYSINNWIDLIFGYKQKGKQAIQNLNMFYYLTYQDAVDWDSIESQKQTNALESQIINFGQTPSQIFTKPHPQRNTLHSFRHYNMICDNNAQIKVYRPSNNKNLLQDQIQLNPFKQPGQSIVHMKWVKQDKLVFIRRNGEMLFYKWHLPGMGSLSNSKVPFQCAIQKERKIQKMQKSDPQTNFFFDQSLKVTSFPIQFVNKGNQICVGGLLDGKLSIIDTETNQVIDTYSCHDQTISCVKADSKDNFLITGDVKGNVVVWRMLQHHNSCKLTMYESFRDQKAQISSIFFSYELKCFAVSSLDGSVFVYNIITSKKMRVYYHPHRFPINDVIISTNPLATVAFFSNQQGLIYCYSLNGQLIQRVHEKQSDCFLTVTLMKNSYGFQHIAYGNQHGQTIIRAMPYLDNPKKLTVAKQAVVNRVCPSKNGKYLVTGCSDGQLSVITDPNPITSS